MSIKLGARAVGCYGLMFVERLEGRLEDFTGRGAERLNWTERSRRKEICRSLNFSERLGIFGGGAQGTARLQRRRPPCLCLQATELPPSATTRVTTTQLYIGSQNARASARRRENDRASEQTRCYTDERETDRTNEVLLLLRSISEERRCGVAVGSGMDNFHSAAGDYRAAEGRSRPPGAGRGRRTGAGDTFCLLPSRT